jgi:hypothetical protein
MAIRSRKTDELHATIRHHTAPAGYASRAVSQEIPFAFGGGSMLNDNNINS